MWAFDVGWALVVFFGVRSLTARLLAVRPGPVAGLVCAALGIAAGLGVQRAVKGESTGAVVPYATFAALSLLTTMAVVAVLGLTTRPARHAFGAGTSVPHPIRALRARAARTSRYLSILWLGARYGLGPLTGLRRVRDSRELGVSLCDALQEAGGVFIKFGQLLSARTDLVPATIAVAVDHPEDRVDRGVPAPLGLGPVRQLASTPFKRRPQGPHPGEAPAARAFR
jgi:ubiquinone biosynthesis protein